MALKSCKECNNEVSTKAKECPHCGVKNPTVTAKEQTIATIIMCAIIGFLVAKCSSDGETIATEYKDTKEKTLLEIKDYSSKNKKEITDSFLKEHSIDSIYKNDFHKCMSHFVHTKSETLKLQEIMSWCKTEFEQNDYAFVNKYYDLDRLKDQFSGWDGSHYNLTKLIKQSMHDSDSYDHIETRYRLVLSENDPHIFLISQFKGKNAFGAVVKQSVSAKADIETGIITSVIE